MGRELGEGEKGRHLGPGSRQSARHGVGHTEGKKGKKYRGKTQMKRNRLSYEPVRKEHKAKRS